MRDRSASITDLPMSPDEERQRRFRTYLYMMLARVACLGIFFVVPGWWKLVPAAGAIFIPYFAVVVANQVTRQPVEVREIPNALPAVPTPQPETWTPPVDDARPEADERREGGP